MKTLGDTGLMPKKKGYDPYSDTYSNCTREGDNRTIDKISAIPILAVVQKAVEMNLVKLKGCDEAYFDNSGNLKCFDFETSGQCPTCSGNGFTITEGE